MNEKTNEKQTIIINLYGPPSSGKSTMRSRIFSELKYRHINCEEVTEYAKDKTWERNWETLSNQIYVFAKQHHKIYLLLQKVDVIITDSPLLMSVLYDKDKNEHLKKLAIDQHFSMNNINFFLDRNHPYQQAGRYHNEEEADYIGQRIESILKENEVQYESIYSSPQKAIEIADSIEEKIKENQLF